MREKIRVDEWVKARNEFQAKVIEQALAEGLEDKVKGAAALIQLQYHEAIDHLRQLIEKRKKLGPEYGPKDDKAHAEAFEKLVGVARQALGLPKDYAPEIRTQDLAPVVVAYLPSRATDGS